MVYAQWARLQGPRLDWSSVERPDWVAAMVPAPASRKESRDRLGSALHRVEGCLATWVTGVGGTGDRVQGVWARMDGT